MGYGGSNILLLVGQFSYNKLFVLYVDPFQKAQDCQNTSDIAPDVNSCIPKPAPLIMDLFIAVLFATMPYLNCIPFWLVKSAFISHIYIVSQLWSNWYFYLHSSTNAFLADNCFGDNFIVPHFLLLGKFYSLFCKPFVENCHVYFFMWFLRWWVITIQSMPPAAWVIPSSPQTSIKAEQDFM